MKLSPPSWRVKGSRPSGTTSRCHWHSCWAGKKGLPETRPAAAAGKDVRVGARPARTPAGPPGSSRGVSRLLAADQQPPGPPHRFLDLGQATDGDQPEDQAIDVALDL